MAEVSLELVLALIGLVASFCGVSHLRQRRYFDRRLRSREFDASDKRI